jgi:hypothetical protein
VVQGKKFPYPLSNILGQKKTPSTSKVCSLLMVLVLPRNIAGDELATTTNKNTKRCIYVL